MAPRAEHRRPSARIYPLPGTNAHRVLRCVQENPGISTNGVIVKLGLNPTVARKCLHGLLNNGKISDVLNSGGHHSYTVRTLL